MSTTHEIAEDLAVLHGRLAARGVAVRLPRAGAAYALPTPLALEPGEDASELLMRLRGRA